MQRFWNSVRVGVVLGFVCVASFSGCESASWNARLKEAFSLGPDTSSEEEELHRTAYVKSRHKEDLYWLLANRVDAGMKVAEVNAVLGEVGEIETNGQWLKAGSELRVDDDVYRYGPDSTGNTLFLAFREGKLTNYDREQFRTRK